MNDVTLRPVNPDDDEFLCAVYGSTREEELAQVPWAPGQRERFIRFQFDAQQHYYQTEYPAAEHHAILSNGERIGRLYVDRRAQEIRILDIALLTAARGRGVGSLLLGQLMDEAKAAQKPLTIHLDLHGRSRALFLRLGFAPVSDSETHTLFTWGAAK